jgi:gliding motility-associated-like protein
MFRLFIFLYVLSLRSALLMAQNPYQVLLESGDVVLRNPKLNETGELLYVQGVLVNTVERKAHLTQLDEKGNVKWAKSFGKDGLWSNIVDFLPVSDGVLVPVSEIDATTSNAYYLVKFDVLGNMVWNIRLADNTLASAPLIVEMPNKTIWIAFSIEENNDNKIIFGQVSAEGKVLFLKKFYPQMSTLIESIVWSAKAQSLLFSCRVSEGGTPRSVIGAIDLKGALKWAWKATDFRFQNMVLLGDKIILYSVKNSFQLSDIFSIHNIFDGKVLNTKSIEDMECYSASDNRLVLQYGDTDIAVAYDVDFSPLWAYQYPTCTVQPQVEMHINDKGDWVIWKRIADKSLITKPNPNGLLTTCVQKKVLPPPMKDIVNKNFVDISTTFEASDFAFAQGTQGIFTKTVTTFSATPFCPPMPNADFEVADSICREQEITPKLAANASFSNFWVYESTKTSKEQYPVLKFSKEGKSSILHIVENGNCSDTATHLVQILAAPIIPFGDTTLCGADNVAFDFSVKGGVQYWLDGIALNPPKKRIEKEGIYKLKVSNGFCESDHSFFIKKRQRLDIQFDIKDTLCKNELFLAQINGFDKVFWNGKQQDTLHIRDAKIHYYTAQLSDCKTEGTLKIERKACKVSVYFPNIFSPNDDGINDVYEPLGEEFEGIDFRIFNRWGNVVFQSGNSRSFAWNGTFQNRAAPEDVYTFYFTFLNKKTNEIEQKTGSFLLIASDK